MFKGDIGEKVVLGESFGSEDDVSDIVVDSMKIISLKDNLNPILIESPIQRDSIAPCKCLCSLHDEHKDSLCQFSVETNHVSTHLTTNAQMTFLVSTFNNCGAIVYWFKQTHAAVSLSPVY